MNLERLWNQSGLMFGKMWEDPEVERELMWQVNSRRVLCVASAGDTALALAAGKGVKVTALDINPAQIHLCRLKQALLNVGTLPTAIHSDARRHLAHVEPLLEADTQGFWREHRDLLKSGIGMCGRVDAVMSLWARTFQLLLVSESKVKNLLETRHPAVQKTLFQEEWDGRLWRWAFRLILHPWILKLIYPKEFVKCLPSGLSDIMRRRMESFLTSTPAKGNPYLWQTFLPHEADAPRPPYLISNGHVDFQIGTIGSPFQRRSKYDFFALSNILEAASDDECATTLAALRSMARPRAIAVLRFMVPRPLVWQEAEYLEKESAEARVRDRAFFCNEIQVYRVS